MKSYHCLVDGSFLGVTYEKRWKSQVETSKRLLLPIFGGKWYGACLGVILLVLLNIPLLFVLSGLFVGWYSLQLAALCLLGASMLMYAIFTYHTWHRNWWIGGLFWPVVIVQELILMVRSIWGYARHTVTWKGRPVDASPIRSDRFEIEE